MDSQVPLQNCSNSKVNNCININKLAILCDIFCIYIRKSSVVALAMIY